jgi:hypothetical protein
VRAHAAAGAYGRVHSKPRATHARPCDLIAYDRNTAHMPLSITRASTGRPRIMPTRYAALRPSARWWVSARECVRSAREDRGRRQRCRARAAHRREGGEPGCVTHRASEPLPGFATAVGLSLRARIVRCMSHRVCCAWRRDSPRAHIWTRNGRVPTATYAPGLVQLTLLTPALGPRSPPAP